MRNMNNSVFVDEESTLVYGIYDKISKIYEHCNRSNKNWTSELKTFFDSELPNICDKLPWLNEYDSSQVQPNQLVRFRGMVQDMYNPEFYLDTYCVSKSDGSKMKKIGRYMDIASISDNCEISLDSDECDIKNRNIYCCISIPGEAPWAKKVYSGQKCRWLGRAQREFQTTSLKRKAEDTDEMEIESMVEEKKLKPTRKDEKSKSCKNFSDLKSSQFPFEESAPTICLLKVYDDQELKLNDIIDVIGIINFDVVVGDEEQSEQLETFLPPSLVPRLHAVNITKRIHCNPLLPSVIKQSDLPHYSSNLYELLRPVLTVALLGDEVAADYLICHLISSIYSRQNDVILGKFCLNLSGITSNLLSQHYSAFLFGVIQNLTSLSYLLHFTIESINKSSFIPKKNYEENHLVSGLLQLPSNLHLVVDETKLSNGQLDANGLKNLTALSNMVTRQKVDYDFQFYNLEQFTNIPVLILSEAKAMINCDFHVKLHPVHTDVSSASSEVSSMLSIDLIDQIRIHLTIARSIPHTMNENMQKIVQEDFVSSRQQLENFTAENLHSLLTLARLLAQSTGKVELTEGLWRKAKMLECQRKERLTDNSA